MNMTDTITAGSAALKVALEGKSASGVMGVLDGLAAADMAEVLKHVGFAVPDAALATGRQGVFNAVKEDLQAALQRGLDGHGLQAQRGHRNERDEGVDTAVALIRAVMASPKVSVMPLGDTQVAQRAALQMIAAQGLRKGHLGFGVEGAPGKFELDASLPELVQIHSQAAEAWADLTARAALVSWSQGAALGELSDWIPDSMQRLLNGSLTVESAERMVTSLNEGVVGRYASDRGAVMATDLLAQQGLDANAPSVEQQAREQGLRIKEPDRLRGQYFGAVVGQDHRSALIKVNRDEAVILTVREMDGQRPDIGSNVRIGFKAGVLSISHKSAERGGPSR
jgi:hypothetical protein